MQLILSCVSLSLAKFTIFLDKSLLEIPFCAISKISFSSTTSHIPSEEITTNISSFSTFLKYISGVDNTPYFFISLSPKLLVSISVPKTLSLKTTPPLSLIL